jgi:hypothetical protein
MGTKASLVSRRVAGDNKRLAVRSTSSNEFELAFNLTADGGCTPHGRYLRRAFIPSASPNSQSLHKASEDPFVEHMPYLDAVTSKSYT